MKHLLLLVFFVTANCYSLIISQVEMSDATSFFYLTADSYYLPGEEICIKLWGTTASSNNYSFKLFKVDQPDSFYTKQIPAYYYSPFDYKLSFKPGYVHVIKSWDDEMIFRGEDKDTVSTDLTIGKIQKPGLYQLQVSTHSKSAYISFFVTNYGFTIKTIGKKYLCFVSDLKSGEFASNCNLDFYYKDKFIYKKNTGATGILLDSFPDTLYQYLNYKEIIITGNVGDDYFVCRPILEYDDYKLNSQQLFSIKDKDHYEPGDSVKFVGIFRELKPEGVFLPSNDKVYRDGEFDAFNLESKALLLNEYGMLDQSFQVKKPPYSTSYQINWQLGPEQSVWDDSPFVIRVDDNPRENLKIICDKKTFTKGELIKAKVKYVNPNSVLPKSNQIKIDIVGTPYSLPWWVDDEFSELLSVEYGNENFSYNFSYSRDSIFGTLDQNGEFSFEYLPEGIDDDYIYEIYANLLDGRQYTLGANFKTVVSRGSVLSVLYPDKKVYAVGEPIILKLKVKSLDQYKHIYNYKLSITPLKDSAGIWVNDKTEFFFEGVTDINGKASVTFDPIDSKCLRYAASVIVLDSEGSEITERIEIPLRSPVNDNAVINPLIVTDRELYLPGDTMHVWIDFPGENFLLTFERGMILDQKKIVNANGRQFFSIVLDTLFTPDFIINVYGTSNGKYFFEEKFGRVLSTHKFLKMDIKTNQYEFKPADTVKASVIVTDMQGNSIKDADVTVVVKSKPNKNLLDYGKRSIYEIFYTGLVPWDYRTRLNSGIDPSMIFNRHAKLKSFDDIYPDKKNDAKRNKKYKIYYKIINQELDESKMFTIDPQVKFLGNSGEIYIPYFLDSMENRDEIESFRMVPEGYYNLCLWDASILDLLDKKQDDNLKSYYTNYLVGTYYINCDTTLIINYDYKSDWSVINTREEEDRTVYGTSNDNPYAFRRENIFDEWTGIFRDPNPVEKQYNAYWKTNLRTDENGIVKFSFTVPDKEVEWIINAYAVTKDSKVGEKKIPLKIVYQVLMKNDHASFIRGGDISFIKTSLKNNSEKLLNADIKLEISGATLLSCTSMENNDSYELPLTSNEYNLITIPPGRELFLEWEICADKKTKVINYSVTLSNPNQFIRVSDSLMVVQEESENEIIYSDVTDETNFKNTYEIDLTGITKESNPQITLLIMPSMPATVNLSRDRLNSSKLINNIDFASRFLIDTSYKQLYKILNKNYPQYKWNFDSTILYARYESGYALQNQNVCGWFNSLSGDPYVTAFIVYVNSQKNPKDWAYNVFNLVKRYNNLEEFYFKQKYNDKFDFAFSKFSLYQYYAKHRNDFSTVRYSIQDKNLLSIGEEISRSLELKDIDTQGDGFKQILNNLVERYHDSLNITGNYPVHLLMDTLLVTSENQTDIIKTNPFNGSRMMLTYFLLKLRSFNRYDDIKTQKVLQNFIKDADKNYKNIPLYNSLLVSAIRNYLGYHSLEVPSYRVSIKANNKIIFEQDYYSTSGFENPVSVSVPDELIQKYFGDKLNIEVTKRGEGYLHYNIVTRYNKKNPTVDSIEGIRIEKKYTKIVEEESDEEIEYKAEADFSKLKIGDYLLVETTISLPKGIHSYFVVEELLPAGFSVVVDKVPVLNSLEYLTGVDENEYHLDYDTDKLRFYYPLISSKIKILYLLRAEIPGSVIVPPSKAFFTYKPFLRSYSDQSQLNVIRD